MTNERIEVAIRASGSMSAVFEISFKTRKPIKGMFIESPDFRELSRKNLWRIVPESRLEEYTKSHDEALARIFNGAEFTKLQLVTKAALN